MRRLLAVVAAAVALAGTGALIATDPGGGDAGGAGAAAGEGSRAQAGASEAMAALATRIAAPWVDRRSSTGLFVDPITGGAGHGYGPGMLAEVLMRAGAREDDRRMLRAGVRALAANAERATGDGNPGNPLEMLAIASAYAWAQRHLARDPDWTRAAAAPRRYLRRWRGAEVGRAAARCFATPACWNNYKIIQAAGKLQLLATRLAPASGQAKLAQPDATRAEALDVLARDVPRAIGRDAATIGPTETLRGAGVLSDEPAYPLAYHAMAVAGLARTLELAGDDAPRAARDVFMRAMVAGTSFTAPDGDVAFLGRAQGESWALAATAYAGQYCARTFRDSAPRIAGRCVTLALRALRRLERVHGFRDGLFAIIPRFRREPLSAAGLEHYARVMTFNALTALFLEWGSEAARAARDVRPERLPLDAGGTFTDADRARMAVVRRGGLWYVIHAHRPEAVDDIRYDFGLLSLKLRLGGRWRDVLPPRPLEPFGAPRDSAGPVLETAAGPALPTGTSFRADPSTGTVVIRGGWRTLTAGWVQRGAEFRYTPRSGGVNLTVQAPPGSVLRFQDFLPEEGTQVLDGGQLLSTATMGSRLSAAPAAVEQGLEFASSYATGLRGYRRWLTVPPSGRVGWTIAAR